MKNKSVETEFINWLIASNPTLNKSKSGKDVIVRRGPGERLPHVRFYAGCGVTSSNEFLKLFDSFEYSSVSNNEFSKEYSVGGYITWQNKKVGVLYGVAEKGHSENKRWSPESLGLNGFTTDNLKNFRIKIIAGLNDIGETKINLFTSLLDNIEFGTPVEETSFLKTNKSKITKDFGEILSAFDDVKKGFKIKFPNKSNQKVSDYSVLINNEWKKVSVKNPKGGGKVNLSDFVNLIDTSDNNVHASILYSIGSHNRDSLFELTSTVCPQVKKIKDIIGGLTKRERMEYVNTHTYNEFYDEIKKDQLFVLKKETLGIPNDQGWKLNELTPRALWAEGSLEPLDFTINTLISRFWGELNVEGISKVVTKFLNKPKFKVVDISNNRVIITEREFKDINKWKTVYWSRATKAWHNWMAVQPVKEKE